jgi:hypothetical protein
MRRDLGLLGLVCLAIVACIACGGNVVVDDASATSTGGSVTTGGSGGASAACVGLSGEQLSNGGCVTDATCNGQSVVIQCGPDPSQTQGVCTCTVNGSAVGTCTEPLMSSTLCSPTAGCCASSVGG